MARTAAIKLIATISFRYRPALVAAEEQTLAPLVRRSIEKY
jgi:hypothetical protein